MRAGGSGAKNRHGEAGAGRGAGRDAEIRQSPESGRHGTGREDR